MPEVTDRISAVLREHLAVCNDLLALAQKESEVLKSPEPFPATQVQAERKGLLERLNATSRAVSECPGRWQQSHPAGAPADPEFAQLLQTTLDTIMRVLVLDRENEQHLLRRGLLPARALPPAEQSQPGYVARLYQRHTQS